MMAVHCLLFLENGDMYRGVVFLHLACPVNPLWPNGDWPEACYPVFTSQEQNQIPLFGEPMVQLILVAP